MCVSESLRVAGKQCRDDGSLQAIAYVHQGILIVCLFVYLFVCSVYYFFVYLFCLFVCNFLFVCVCCLSLCLCVCLFVFVVCLCLSVCCLFVV